VFDDTKIMNDKIKHIIAGSLIALVTIILINIFWNRDFMYFGILTSALAGLGKELVWDKWFKKGTCEFADFWFTVWGGLAITILSYFML
jgi:hypothetical protein